MAIPTEDHEDHSKASPEQADRMSYILRMRTEGWPMASIAHKLELSTTYTQKLYKAALERIYVDDVETHRKVENHRLEKLEREALVLMEYVAPLVNSGKIIRQPLLDDNGNPKLDAEGKMIFEPLRDMAPFMKSIELRLKIAQRRAALNGLDMPAKMAFTDPTGENESKLIQFYLPDNNRAGKAQDE